MTRARDNSFNPFNNQAAGKNFIINGAFDFWQRGTSFAAAGAATTSTYTADRWNSGANSNITISRVAATTQGLQYALRIQKNSGTSTGGDAFVCHTIESNNALFLAGKTVTLSFNVRKGADFSGTAVYCVPRFGTGTDEGSLAGYNGQWTGYTQIIHTVSPTTTMTNYSKTFTVPSGTKEIMLLMGVQSFPGTSAGTNDWVEFEQIQLELGPNATQFSRAGGTIGGELALCQRYYQRWSTNNWYAGYMTGYSDSTTTGSFVWQLVNTMRTNPTFAASSASVFLPWTTGNMSITQIAMDSVTTNSIAFYVTYNSTVTAGQGVRFRNYADNTSFLEATAEL